MIQNQPLRNQHVADGVYIVIKTPSNNRSWRVPMPYNIHPQQVGDYLMGNPQFTQFRQVVSLDETLIEMERYRGGYCERSVLVKASGVPLAPNQDQTGPQQGPQLMSAYEQQQGNYPNGDQMLQDMGGQLPLEPLDGPGMPLPTVELLRRKIEIRKRQIFNLESLLSIVHNMPQGSPEEQAIRELLQGEEA
jgi:hypothetical protein